jgi:hypothetical protein
MGKRNHTPPPESTENSASIQGTFDKTLTASASTTQTTGDARNAVTSTKEANVRYRVKTGMAYPTDAMVDDAMRELARQVEVAAVTAAETCDARDIDAAATAERTRDDAMKFCFANGLVKEAVLGDVVDDLPPQSIGWLLEQGHIEIDNGKIPEVWRDLGRPDDADFGEGRVS